MFNPNSVQTLPFFSCKMSCEMLFRSVTMIPTGLLHIAVGAIVGK